MTTKGTRRSYGSAKDDILKAATKLFAERGFAAVTLRAIAAKAHVHVPSIYAHFGDKRALYLRCGVHALSIGASDLPSALRPDYSPAEQLYAFMLMICRKDVDKPMLDKLVQRQLLDGDREAMEQLALCAADIYSVPLQRIVAALLPGEDPGMMAFRLISLSFGAAHLHGFHQLTGWVDPSLKEPMTFTEFILGSFFSDIDWAAVAASVKRKG